mmetsp:Transcript_14739/g.55557  ORF Transcript_14739/g.55557 Transcript_14739/m.55557 type:complete len:222 (+) Transcript_14739:3023-3688(+)
MLGGKNAALASDGDGRVEVVAGAHADGDAGLVAEGDGLANVLAEGVLDAVDGGEDEVLGLKEAILARLVVAVAVLGTPHLLGELADELLPAGPLAVCHADGAKLLLSHAGDEVVELCRPVSHLHLAHAVRGTTCAAGRGLVDDADLPAEGKDLLRGSGDEQADSLLARHLYASKRCHALLLGAERPLLDEEVGEEGSVGAPRGLGRGRGRRTGRGSAVVAL